MSSLALATSILWTLGAVLLFCFRVYETRVDPDSMPGGGITSLAMTALVWPLVLVIALLMTIWAMLA